MKNLTVASYYWWQDWASVCPGLPLSWRDAGFSVLQDVLRKLLQGMTHLVGVWIFTSKVSAQVSPLRAAFGGESVQIGVCDAASLAAKVDDENVWRIEIGHLKLPQNDSTYLGCMY